MNAATGICRACGAPLSRTFVDLGETPLANSYLTVDQLGAAEPRYPLHARVCDQCLLVQLDAVTSPAEIFAHYPYFSSYSDSWVQHARSFANMARKRFRLGEHSRVVEVASNDGYLLRHFKTSDIPVLGIEPAANVAEIALADGIPTEVRFFGMAAARDLRERGVKADLLVANNVLAHVPDLQDFVAGLAHALAPDGVLSIEVPHILRLIEQLQFDTIYHEHFSYFSLLSLEFILNRYGVRVFDVEELGTHGGSLRVLGCLVDAARPEADSVAAVRESEEAFGLGSIETYTRFHGQVSDARRAFRHFLEALKADGKSVVAYGAAAKGNTLLNSTGLGCNDIAFVVDRSPHKQGLYLPGSRLAIRAPEDVRHFRPDVLLVLAWNLLEEVVEQMSFVRDWGCEFVIPVPRPLVVR